MIVIIDNYDSFTYNLLQPLAGLDQDIRVFRNDALSLAELKALKPAKLIISSGPGSVEEAGISLSLVKELASDIPILGISMGHHCIARAFSASLIAAQAIMHGKQCEIFHKEAPLFRGVPSPFKAICYHSQVVDPDTLPEALEAIAWHSDGTIMALAHRELPLVGFQFHPESIQTEWGELLLGNFMAERPSQGPLT